MAEASEQNWYRVCLNTIVRKGKALDSERLRILPMGSRVRVVDTVERRVKIDQPIEGWCSLTSSNGDQILHPLDAEELGPTTPQMRSKQGTKLLQTQMQQNEDALHTKQEDKEKALENPKIKKLFDDIQNIKNQLIITEAQSHQLKEEQQLQKHNERNKEINALRLEEYNEKVKQMRTNLANKQEEIQKRAEQAGLKNPDQLEGELTGLQKRMLTLSGEMKQNETILQQLKTEAESISNMMEQYVNIVEYEQEKKLKGDVLKLGSGFGMAVIGWVKDDDIEYGCFLESPVDDAALGDWPKDYPPLCDGMPHMEGYMNNQCFFVPYDHHLSQKSITGATLLAKLEQVISLVEEAQIDNNVE